MRCCRGRSEALHPQSLLSGPSPGLPKNKFLFPCFSSPFLLLSLPSHLPPSLKHLLTACSISGTLLGPGNKKMSQTQGQPWETHLIQISIYNSSVMTWPRQALPINHSTLPWEPGLSLESLLYTELQATCLISWHWSNIEKLFAVPSQKQSSFP